jgi:hypothetical protein
VRIALVDPRGHIEEEFQIGGLLNGAHLKGAHRASGVDE